MALQYRCETDSVLRLKFPLSPPVTAYGRARTHWLFNTETDSVLRLKFPLSPPVTAYGRARTHGSSIQV